MKLIRFFILVNLLISYQSAKEELPILGYTINSDGEKETYSITYSDFTDQDGKDVPTKRINNKIVVANFFFTSCPSICPPMRMQRIEVANAFTDENQVLLISHSIDQKNDTVKVLKSYSEATNIPNSKWLFLTSSEEHTKQQAKQLMTNFKSSEDRTDFYHGSYTALLDEQQMIHSVYNILIPAEVEHLKKAIKTLLK
jgi:protein SCO1/2